MPEHQTRRIVQAAVMTALAGYADAIGYAQSTSLFVSFMSGNSTSFGAALVAGDHHMALILSAVILAFVCGAILGGVLTALCLRPSRPVLTAQIVILTVAAVTLATQDPVPGLIVLALAMGLQNSLAFTLRGAGLGKSFVTGSLVGFGQGLGRAIMARRLEQGVLLDGLWWLIFIAGVVAGSIAAHALGAAASVALAIAPVFILYLAET
ncbi:MAG: DUF1275 family protein [Paracoccus sp. (in: a-proteobacteria)]|uniref:YoaK family protein n=1 Tax=Paracoccus sp. TaxID=267 RepID=UPI0026DF3AF0|nr:DUF1275 family protein [Paracoccus sp. (in: a-proteobacteria)]MDO5620926.1 DUF1275 family protein [Paracoccus sp. (in: a-proteobacteria)]